MTGSLEGWVAVVTGSAQGVGRGIAILLAREGAKVVTNGLRPASGDLGTLAFRATALKGDALRLNDEEASRYRALTGDAEGTAAEIRRAGGEAIAVYADVTDEAAARELIETAVERFGRIDILVNNAAGLGFGPFVDLTEEDWHHQIDAKVTGSYHCMRFAVPHMIEQGFGRILNSSSDAWTGIASLSAYSAANAAVVALTKSTAKELAQHGITVNAYCPQAESPGHVSFTATFRSVMERAGLQFEIDHERMAASEAAHGPAEHLVFLAYLATNDAADISGAVFSVTAGGDVALYSEPVHLGSIHKQGEPWTVDELRTAVPQRLLADYVSITHQREF